MNINPIKLPAENLRTLHGECCAMFDMAHRLGVEVRNSGESERAQRYAREVVETFYRMSRSGLVRLAEAAHHADLPPVPEPIKIKKPPTVGDDIKALKRELEEQGGRRAGTDTDAE